MLSLASFSLFVLVLDIQVWRAGRMLSWPHFGLMCLHWLPLSSTNDFILQSENVWKVQEVQGSAWCRGTAHPSPPGAAVTLSTGSLSTEARGTKWRAGRGVPRLCFSWEQGHHSGPSSQCAGAYLAQALTALIMIKSQPVSFWTQHFCELTCATGSSGFLCVFPAWFTLSLTRLCSFDIPHFLSTWKSLSGKLKGKYSD